MEVNPNNGPDIISKNKIMEVKFDLVSNSKTYYSSWTVFEYQMNYNNGKTGYWGLGRYWLSEDINRIKTVNLANLERMVEKRELFVVPWDWMYQFPPHYTKGKTDNSEWENTLRYPKLKYVPPTIASYEVEKGIVHLTEGVSKNAFFVNRKIQLGALPYNVIFTP